MKLAPYFFLFVLLVSSALAFDCSYASDSEVCEEVLDSDLGRSEIEEALSSLFYEKTSNPDHDFVSEYNKAIEVNSAPNDVEIIDSSYIYDAWVSLDTLSPSVYETDELLVPPEVEAIFHSDYSVSIPGSYTASKYPYTNSGYCKRR